MPCLTAQDIGKGYDKTKKEAKRLAAMEALKHLGVRIQMGPAVDRPHGEGPPAPVIGPQPAPPAAAEAAGSNTGAGGATGGGGGGAAARDSMDGALHRLMDLYTKDNCIFEVHRDEGMAPHRWAGRALGDHCPRQFV